MGTLRSVYESTRVSAPEHLAALEAKWRNEAITVPLGGEETIFRPDDQYTELVTLDGPSSVRWRLRVFLPQGNGNEVEPFSVEETVALTQALELRFALLDVRRGFLKQFEKDWENPDFEWLTGQLDALARVMCGYVNLVAVINTEDLAVKDRMLEINVMNFLSRFSDSIIEVFDGHGGADAFRARTSGVEYNDFGARTILLGLETRQALRQENVVGRST